MTRDLLVGIDVGTTGVKAVLVDGRGTLLSGAGQEIGTTYPQPYWAEQDAEEWWQATCGVLRRLFVEHPAAAIRIAAVGVSAQAPSVVAVDRQGRPLGPALIWMDRRSEVQCAWLHERVGEETITRLNGGRIDPYYLAPKLLWLRQERPDLYRAAHRLLLANGFVVHRLCGAFSLDASHGPLTLFFDSAVGAWSEPLLERMGLDPQKLPAIFASTEVVGHVSPEAAAACGLAPGTPVVAGMTDGTAAGLEAGLVRVGDAVEMTGQSTVLLICSDRPYLGRELIPLGHAIPGRYLVVGALVASGGSLRWFRDVLGEAERETAAQQGGDAFDLLTAAAAASPAGANGLLFLPYMYGERSPIWDSHARGVFFGLSLATRRADLVRAILEGAAFGLRHNVETAAAAGFDLATLACVGGGARSALWNQIKADVLKRPIRLPQTAIGAPLGDAMAAAAGIGLHASLEEAVAAMTARGEEYLPDAAASAVYDRLYPIYRELYPALRASFARLAEVGDAAGSSSAPGAVDR